MIVNADSKTIPHARRTAARRLVKHALAAAFHPVGTLRGLLGPRRTPRVVILGYHRIVDDVAAAARTCMPALCVSTRAFADHLDVLQRRYEILSLEDAARVLAGRRRTPRRDAAVITFDDGYADVRDNALPLLSRRGLPSTMFVSTGVLDGESLLHDRMYVLCRRVAAAGMRILGIPIPDELTWPLARADYALEAGDPVAAADAILQAMPIEDALRVADALAARVGDPGPNELPALLRWDDMPGLIAGGMTLGAHGVSHAHMPVEGEAALDAELRQPRLRFAQRLGVTPAALAYPAGRFDDRVVAAARRAGYQVAVTTEDRPNRAGVDLLRLGRKCLSDDHGVGAFGVRSQVLVAAHMDGLFTSLGLAHPVRGDFRLEGP